MPSEDPYYRIWNTLDGTALRGGRLTYQCVPPAGPDATRVSGLPRGMYIAWQGTGPRFVSRVGTLGLGGLFIDVPDPAPVGEIIRIYFEVPGGGVRARAVVRDSHPGRGMGVEFTAMGQEARGRLDRLLRRLVTHTKFSAPD